jgi:anti-sigma regulatory factor (Ser/Thr protein kinase)
MSFQMTASSTHGSGPLEQMPMPSLASAPARVFGFNLRAGPLAAAEARHAFQAAEDTLSEDERQPMLLMLTELVTNAVRHGEGAERPRGVAVKVVESDGAVGAAVTNPGVGFEWSGRESDDPLEPGGYGLVLVDRMSSRWGIDRSPGSTTVWFELDRATA